MLLSVIADYHDECVAQAEESEDMENLMHHTERATWNRIIGEHAEYHKSVPTHALSNLNDELNDHKERVLEVLDPAQIEELELDTADVKELTTTVVFCRLMAGRCSENMLAN